MDNQTLDCRDCGYVDGRSFCRAPGNGYITIRNVRAPRVALQTREDVAKCGPSARWFTARTAATEDVKHAMIDATRAEPPTRARRLTFALPCAPPETTAQGKRLGTDNQTGAPRMFRSKAMRALHQEWQTLLIPFVPATPFRAPIAVWITLIYPHLKATSKSDWHRHLFKVSKPDVDNAPKAFIDAMAKCGFFTDDAHIAELHMSKFHGPDADVGIRVILQEVDQ